MSDILASPLAGELLSGGKVLGVVRERLKDATSSYEHYLVIEHEGLTRTVPVGGALTIHSYEKPNKWDGLFK